MKLKNDTRREKSKGGVIVGHRSTVRRANYLYFVRKEHLLVSVYKQKDVYAFPRSKTLVSSGFGYMPKRERTNERTILLAVNFITLLSTSKLD